VTVRRPPQKYVVAAAFVAAMFLNILDSTIVNVALPSIADAFGAEATAAEWVVLGYLLSLAVFIPASGWIGDRFGSKRTFLVAVALFTGASIMCGLAGSLGQLVAFRLLQGVGGGMMTPVGTAMLFRAFPPSERAAASRVLIIPTVMAPALGPVIGGFLVDTLSWRWIFLVNVPIGLAVVMAGAVLLEEHREPDAGRFDLPGFVLSGTGLALLLYALSRGADVGWASPTILATAIGGVIVVAALVVVELRAPEPLLHLRLFGDRLFRATNLACFFGFGAFLAMLFTASLFVQSGQGLSPLDAGLAVFPEAVGVLAGSQVAARLYNQVGPRRLMTGGLTLLALMLLALSRLGFDTSLWTLRGLLFVGGFGMGFVFLPLQAATFARISQADMGQASALYNTQRQTAGATGVAVAATVLASLATGTLSDSAGPFHGAFLAAAALGAVGAACAWLGVRDADAAATMGRAPAAAGERGAELTAPADAPAGGVGGDLPGREPARTTG
jgi:EmrB/QacA subfamily drug resistance transporter